MKKKNSERTGINIPVTPENSEGLTALLKVLQAVSPDVYIRNFIMDYKNKQKQDFHNVSQLPDFRSCPVRDEDVIAAIRKLLGDKYILSGITEVLSDTPISISELLNNVDNEKYFKDKKIRLLYLSPVAFV